MVGKLLIGIGIAVVVFGAVCLWCPGNLRLGQLPGDLHIRKGDVVIYFPVVTCVIVSIIGSLIVWLITRGH